MAVEALAQRWRDEAALLRRRGAEAQAAALESCASELEEENRRLSLESLTLEQAERESGYAYDSLQKMLADGRLPNVGGPHRPRIRRRDLPKKPGGSKGPPGEPDLAARVLAA